MRFIPSPYYTLLLFFLTILVLGCDSDSEERVSVRGKISYRGVPLFTGVVVFTPDTNRGSSGLQARAEVQPDGTYSLKTGDHQGVCAGWYRVTVISLEAPAPIPRQNFSIPRSLIPEKYRDSDSGLACEVKAGKENEINFNLD
ncbi:MAG TPA: hypothetical protein VGY77_00645 [Gemmataceae bacterium]|nr:hypothetical protein [Gemmataceae bacterium]